MKLRIYAFLVFNLSTFLWAQKPCLYWLWNESKQQYESGFQSENYRKSLDSLMHAGYYSLRIDSIQKNELDCNIYVNLGNEYKKKWIKQENGNFYVWDKTELNRLKDSLIQENHPFAKISLSPTGIKERKAIYELKVDLDSERKITNIQWVGYQPKPKGFTKHILPKNTLDINATIQYVENKISNNPYITIKQPSKISYTTDSTILYVYTHKVKSNSFDGLIGFSNESKKIQLNGNIRFLLNNVLNRLESIELDWFGENNDSQKLNFNVSFPYLIDKIGTHTQLKIRKQDSTFLQLRLSMGLSYKIDTRHNFEVIYNIENSNHYEGGLNNGKDYNKSGFGVGYEYINHNETLLKQNKLGVHIYTNLLKKSIDEEQQTEIGYNAIVQRQLWKNHYVFSQVQGENLIHQENHFLWNELYQLGGMNNLRGFNQNSIFSAAYNICSLSYRYIPSNNFLIEVFSDWAWIQNFENNEFDRYTSFGTGIQFKTKLGILKLIYALGKNESQPIDFGNGKVHFGIAAQF